MFCSSRRLLALVITGAALVSHTRGAEIVSPSVTQVNMGSLPANVCGLARSGSGTKLVQVALKDSRGKLCAQPAVAVLESAPWSPADAERDGASEFEVLMCTARLIKANALSGVIGVGNRNGMFLPGAEVALNRAALMGFPVVKIANGAALPANSDNLFIEAGNLSAQEARDLLAACLLRYGTLPPSTNPLKPTSGEIAAITAKVKQYQDEFDRRGFRPLQIAQTKPERRVFSEAESFGS